MIAKVVIRGYRKFQQLEFNPRMGMNILVGDNNSGKSTIVEAMCLALTCRINGRPAREELNPHWFNQANVNAFFAAATADRRPEPPSIQIEIYFADEDGLLGLHGANNSQNPTHSCPGMCLSVELDPLYADEFWQYVEDGHRILPVEFYSVSWRSFRGTEFAARPRCVTVALIDGRTIRSTSAVDYHMRQTLNDNLSEDERQRVSTAFRAVKDEMTTQHLEPINQRLQGEEGLPGGQVTLAMDQTTRTGWESIISPHVGGLPFSLAGHGEQAMVKISLAMCRAQEATRIVFVEEPENHQSHTNLGRLLDSLSEMRAANQQIFVVTHSSFVLNRLGTDSLVFVGERGVSAFESLTEETAAYFRKLPGYDTLRLVLANKIVLVEGPSDEILFQRFYRDRFGTVPISDGIDVLSMGGISLKRCLELCQQIGRRCAALRDLDKQTPAEIRADLDPLLLDGERQVFLGEQNGGPTLEPQLIAANDEEVLRTVLGIQAHADLPTWMKNNKTEAAIRIFDSNQTLIAPAYIVEAVTFIHG